MLSYLALCARQRLRVVAYEDRAAGTMREDVAERARDSRGAVAGAPFAAGHARGQKIADRSTTRLSPLSSERHSSCSR